MTVFSSRVLLGIGGLVELLTGLLLVALPGTGIQVLLGAEVAGPAVLVARALGLALLALGLAAWLARNDPGSPALCAILGAMLVYNVGATVLMVVLALSEMVPRLVPWLVTVLHALLATGFFVVVRKKACLSPSA